MMDHSKGEERGTELSRTAMEAYLKAFCVMRDFATSDQELAEMALLAVRMLNETAAWNCVFPYR